MRVVRLKDGMPLVRDALVRVERELALARSGNVAVIKFVHGYGSTGRGGDIRIAVQKELVMQLSRGELRHVIFGEDWRISSEPTWELLKTMPQLKSDADLGRRNKGITVVVL
jgi:hypothetical protein